MIRIGVKGIIGVYIPKGVIKGIKKADFLK